MSTPIKNQATCETVSLSRDLAPALSPSEVLRKIVRKWENFAWRVQRNDDIRRAVYEAAGGMCALCREPLREKNMHVHHVTYEYLCVSDYEGSIPPCSGCRRFSDCVARLRAVHYVCHERIHGVDDETLGKLTEEEASRKRQLRSLLLHPNSIEQWSREQELMLALIMSAGLGELSSQMISGRGKAGLVKRAKRLGLVVDPEAIFKPENWPKGRKQ